MVGQVSSATLLSSCGKKGETEKLISYLVPPEDGVMPDEAVYAPTTCTECPACCGVSLKKVNGWPIKPEGIPGHPVNDGGLCIRGQSSLYRLYHPDRIRSPLLRGENGEFLPTTWDHAFSLILERGDQTRKNGLKNFYLSGRTTGTLTSLADRFCEELHMERLPEFETHSHAALRTGYGILFHERNLPQYRIEESDFLLTLGADLFETFISPVSHARRFSRAKETGRFFWAHLEPHFSLTGANADTRLAIRPGSEADFLLYLLTVLSAEGAFRSMIPQKILAALPRISGKEASLRTGLSEEHLRRLALHFKKAGHPLLITGGLSTAHSRGTETAVLSGLIQWATGMDRNTLDFSRSETYSRVGTLRDIRDLSIRLDRKEVGLLFLSRINPVRDFPSSYRIRENLKRTRFTIVLTDLPDETTQEADLVLPLSHSLESWGDTSPRRGVRTLIQPMMKPLYGTLSEGEILLRLIRSKSGRPLAETYREYLLSEWRKHHDATSIRELLQVGYIQEEVPLQKMDLDPVRTAGFLKNLRKTRTPKTPILIAPPSIRTFDGRSRDLPILSEVPDPLTTVSYGNWISISPATAEGLSLKDRDEVEFSVRGWSGRLPVRIQPGLPEGVFQVYRDQLGSSPPFPVENRSGESGRFLEGIQIRKTGLSIAIPILSGSLSQRGRGVIPDPVHKNEEKRHNRISLYPEHRHEEYSWGMAIDLDLCIGCSACVAACYIENNIPLVGVGEHLKGREMSWIHLEPFLLGNGRMEWIPMLCQQCESAPCEPVCPVYASYHNPEGLNIQVYNRCVGTRYCSNNCPYKVRRFNWFEHTWKKPLNRMLNPALFVRWKGVMEKCTFCIQRIRKARDRAEDESRKIRDGEIATACGQSCPTGAIVFGNLLDKTSRVYQLAHSSRAYRVFENLGTEPSVYYLRNRREGRSL